jgi:hypothetical protein
MTFDQMLKSKIPDGPYKEAMGILREHAHFMVSQHSCTGDVLKRFTESCCAGFELMLKEAKKK